MDSKAFADLMHQSGTLFAFLLTCICIAYLGDKGWSVLRRGKQFALRDLFVVLTLAGAITGLIVGVATQDQDGALRFKLSDEIDRRNGQPAQE
jgi:hypothetical protein